MELADRSRLPVLTLVDTSGAFPGIQAEERGQAEAIARSTEACLALGVPMVAAVVGEGGSGGAIALASGNRVLMFEHAVYSVISPEGCASILWRTADKAADAAEAMKVTAQDLKALGVIDGIVPEPVGGAHRDPAAAIVALESKTAELRQGEAELETIRQAHYAASDELHASQGRLAEAALEVSRLEERIRYVVDGRQRAEQRLAELVLQTAQWADRRAQAEAELEQLAEQVASADEHSEVLAAQAEEQADRLPGLEDAVRTAQSAASAQRTLVQRRP
jgi:hypothetical protein